MAHEERYTEAQANKLLEQLQCYMAAKGYTQTRVAHLAGIGESALSALFNDKYSGNQDKQFTQIKQFLDREADRAEKPGLTNFAQTSVSTGIFKILRQNFTHGTMGAVIGNSGVGKSRAFSEFSLQNENVIIVSAASWVRSYVQLARHLAGIVIPREKPRHTQDMCKALVNELAGSSRLIIIDQAHQLREDAHEFLQNLWDHCNPSEDQRRLSIVLGCTWRFYNQITSPKAMFLYEQLTRRIDAGASFLIPPSPFNEADIRRLFSPENVGFPIADRTIEILHMAANIPNTGETTVAKGGIGSAIAIVEKIQHGLRTIKASSNTVITPDMIEKAQQVMLRKGLMRKAA